MTERQGAGCRVAKRRTHRQTDRQPNNMYVVMYTYMKFVLQTQPVQKTPTCPVLDISKLFSQRNARNTYLVSTEQIVKQ